MLWPQIVVFLVYAIIAIVCFSFSVKMNKPYVWCLGFIFLLFTGIAAVRVGNVASNGSIADATAKLNVGDSYECLTEPIKDGDAWYVIVKKENGRHLGLRFKEEPPKQGVVAKLNDEIIFLPLTETVTIKNPLVE